MRYCSSIFWGRAATLAAEFGFRARQLLALRRDPGAFSSAIYAVHSVGMVGFCYGWHW